MPKHEDVAKLQRLMKSRYAPILGLGIVVKLAITATVLVMACR